MKPEELKPTRAGLGDDDGRSAYQPGRRRYDRALYGYDQTANRRRHDAAGYLTGEGRREHINRVRRERRNRQRALNGAVNMPGGKYPKHCPDCGKAIDPRGTHCMQCAQSRRYHPWLEPKTREVLERQLNTPYLTSYHGEPPHPSKSHERRVARLEQLRLELPL